MTEARKGVEENIRVCDREMTTVELTGPICECDAGKVAEGRNRMV